MAAQATTDKTLERRVRQLLLLQETAKKVNSILDLEQLLDEIVGGVAEAFGCNRTAILLKDNSTNDLVMIALRGFSNVHRKGYRFRVGGEGMVGHVSATAKMRYAPDVRSDPYYMVSEATTLSEVDIPLISRGKLIGEDSITIEERYCRGDWSVPKTDASAATIGVDPTVIARLDRLKDLMVEVRAGRAFGNIRLLNRPARMISFSRASKTAVRWATRTFSSDTSSRRPESSAYRSSTGSVCAHPTRPG